MTVDFETYMVDVYANTILRNRQNLTALTEDSLTARVKPNHGDVFI